MNILNAIQGRRVYLDTNIWIYTWEEYPTFVTDLRELFQSIDAGDLNTSRLSVLSVIARGGYVAINL